MDNFTSSYMNIRNILTFLFFFMYFNESIRKYPHHKKVNRLISLNMTKSNYHLYVKNNLL